MDPEQTSIRKYEANINVDFRNLDNYYDENDQLYEKRDGRIWIEDEHYYSFSVTVKDDVYSYRSDADDNRIDVCLNKKFKIQMESVTEMECQVDLEVTFTSLEKVTIQSKDLGYFEEIEKINSIKFHLLTKWNVQENGNLPASTYHKIKAIKGTVTLTLVPGNGVILKQKLFKNFSKLLDPATLSKEKSDEFEFHCQNEVIIFHKPLLKTISDAFGNMLNNPNFKETQNGVMIIKKTSPVTVQAFKRIFYDNIIEEKDLNIDMLWFANQYDIEPLVDLCRDHLEKSFAKENIIEFVDAAFKTDDEKFLKKIINFIQLNVADFKEDVAWKNYMKSNPDCATKIMFMLMES